MRGSPRETLRVVRVTVRGWRYTLLPALDLPIRCAGGVWYASYPPLGLCATALAPAALRDAVAEQLHALWQRLLRTDLAELVPAERDLAFRLWWRVRAAQLPIAPASSPCPPGCRGGNGCSHPARP